MIWKMFTSMCLLFLTQATLGQADLLTIYEAALRHDPNLKHAKAEQLAIQEGRQQARAALLPQLNAILNYTDTQRTTDYFGLPAGVNTFLNEGRFGFHTRYYELNLSQPIFNYGIWKRQKMTLENARAAQEQYQQSSQDLMLRIVNAYLDVLQAQDTLTFACAEKRANQRQLKQAEQRYRVGLDPIISVYDAQAACDAIQAKMIQAENAVLQMKEKIRTITGSYFESLYAFKENLPLTQPQSKSAWLARTDQSNHTFCAVRHQLKARDHERGLRCSDHLPTITFHDTLLANRGGTAGFGGLYQHDNVLKFELNVPIFSGGRIASETRQARQRYKQASAVLDRTVREGHAQTRRAYDDLVASIASIEANARAVQSSKQLVDSTEAAFHVGTRTMVNVLNAQKNLYAAERNLARARYQYIRSTAILKHAAGILSLQVLEVMNNWLAIKPVALKTKGSQKTASLKYPEPHCSITQYTLNDSLQLKKTPFHTPSMASNDAAFVHLNSSVSMVSHQKRD